MKPEQMIERERENNDKKLKNKITTCQIWTCLVRYWVSRTFFFGGGGGGDCRAELDPCSRLELVGYRRPGRVLPEGIDMKLL